MWATLEGLENNLEKATTRYKVNNLVYFNVGGETLSDTNAKDISRMFYHIQFLKLK